jgi:steroid delta-isomerase-like uncharacterized protein
MTPQDIRAVVAKMQDDMCKGDLDAIYPYYADEFVFHRMPLPDTLGKEANRKGDEAMLTAFTNNRMTIHEIIVEGDTATMHYTWQAVHSGISPSLGIPPTGKEVRLSGCMVFHWKAGKIIEQWDYTDMLGLMQQLGLVPIPG